MHANPPASPSPELSPEISPSASGDEVSMGTNNETHEAAAVPIQMENAAPPLQQDNSEPANITANSTN